MDFDTFPVPFVGQRFTLHPYSARRHLVEVLGWFDAGDDVWITVSRAAGFPAVLVRRIALAALEEEVADREVASPEQVALSLACVSPPRGRGLTHVEAVEWARAVGLFVVDSGEPVGFALEWPGPRGPVWSALFCRRFGVWEIRAASAWVQTPPSRGIPSEKGGPE